MALDDKAPNTWYFELEEDTSSSAEPLSAVEEGLLRKLLNEVRDVNGMAKEKEPQGLEQVKTAARVPQNPVLGYGAR